METVQRHSLFGHARGMGIGKVDDPTPGFKPTWLASCATSACFDRVRDVTTGVMIELGTATDDPGLRSVLDHQPGRRGERCGLALLTTHLTGHPATISSQSQV